jgi:hypothetical protein
MYIRRVASAAVTGEAIPACDTRPRFPGRETGISVPHHPDALAGNSLDPATLDRAVREYRTSRRRAVRWASVLGFPLSFVLIGATIAIGGGRSRADCSSRWWGCGRVAINRWRRDNDLFR